MYATFELGADEKQLKGDDSIIRIDANIQSMSWMNKSHATSFSMPPIAEYRKMFNHQEGWLATGNSNAMVGCTFTTCLSEQQDEYIKQKEKQLNLKLLNESTTEKSIPLSSISTSNTQTISSNISNTTSNISSVPVTSSYTNSNNNNTNSNGNSNGQNLLTRTNFNLRGHKTDIKFVRWNEPYQKLASCDSKGVIYVWVKYEGRWSIELINDRGNSVSDFAWSHDGKMAAICYQDGFVLVGSVNGQRFWSHLYDLPNTTITSAAWAPNDNFVLIGLSNGNLMVVDEHGTILTRHQLKNDPILSVQYNCPKFFITHEDILSQQATDENNNNPNHYSLFHVNRLRLNANLNDQMNYNFNFNNNNNNNNRNSKINNNSYVIACLLKTSSMIYLMKTYDDLDPVIIDTMLDGVKFEWSNCGKYLAVGGYEPVTMSTSTVPVNPNNFVHFYNLNGVLIYRIKVPSIANENITNKNSVISRLEYKLKRSKNEIQQMFTCLTWGHNDQRLFIACSSTLHILRVYKEIPKFSLFTQISIKNYLKESNEVDNLNLPNRLKEQLKYCYLSTIKSVYPKLSKLRKFVCSSLPNNERLHCTLKCLSIENKSFDDYYVLYLEYLGGLIPLLTARKSSKLKPNFVIFDPFLITRTKQKHIKIMRRYSCHKQSATGAININQTNYESSKSITPNDDSNSSSLTNLNEIKQIAQNRRNKKSIISKRMTESKKLRKTFKKRLLVEIRSNIWGTKFEFIGQSYLPNSIGQIVYKTSLFHLQPRQMKITLDDLTPNTSSMICEPKFESDAKTKKAITKSNTFDAAFNFSTNVSNTNPNKQSSKSLISIQRVTSSTLGAVPSSTTSLDESIEEKSSIIYEFDLSGQRAANLNELTNCNERISTVQQLIENRFDKNSSFFKSNSFNLPILSLTNNENSKNLMENYSESLQLNEYLFTSDTSVNHIEEEAYDEEINLVTSTTETGSSTVTTCSTNSHRPSLLNLYSKLHLSQSKFNWLNRLNGELSIFSSQRFFNIFRSDSSNHCNRSLGSLKKNPRLIEESYQKLDDSNFNSINIKTNKSQGNKHNNKTESGSNKYLDDENLGVDDEYAHECNLDGEKDNEKAKELKMKAKRPISKNSTKQFVLYNKPPIWNETNQVYQLDFGGRVTQESAKNFQIEYGGKQVMQFGRIDSNAYTLDFEWPFTAVQAFSIALANITQRLK